MVKKRQIVLIAHNIRSAHNVGSLLRTAEGLGVNKVYLTGYTPHSQTDNDDRLPHIQQRVSNQIHKTALGAESSQEWRYQQDVELVINELRNKMFTIAALEQSTTSINLPTYEAGSKIALIVGREVEGLEKEVLDLCDLALEIPMAGQKESFNVAQAAAMALYQLALFS